MKTVVISPGIATYGAMLIGGVVREAGHEVALSTALAAGDAEAVLLSLYSTQHLMDPEMKAFVAGVRASGRPVYIGGPVSAYPEYILGELAPDAVVVGEGEATVPRLLEEGIRPDLQGIAYFDGEKTVVTSPAPPVSVERRPLPLIPDAIGQQSIRGANAYIETHRGCTGACTFCQVPRFFGREIRSRGLDEIREEVRAFREKGATRLSVSGGTGSLYGYDGAIDDDAVIALLEMLAGELGPRNVSAPDIRVDAITDEILEAIRKYTIGWLFFGFESGSDQILRQMGKGVTVAQMHDAVEQSRQHGLKVAGCFIVGYPTETAEDYEATKEFIAAEMLDDVFISVAEPIPRTPLADLVLRTPHQENPVFAPHEGEYRSLHLTEAEARWFDLSQHADMYKPLLHVVTDEVFNLYLAEARKQGEDVRRVTALIERYDGGGRE
ncbi:MAG: methyl-coenzyme M reductase glutamine C-methyltransferase [Methanofollis sp.]|uniref:methyl-coenzyme M reductase glutamine C-methyltransferase n=1 Tax=Methanofollis sp. TaxID=2052835 RepID=UPI0026039392|nr:methyl-coenzyme M reductase glutamine C-methyltransferase [Methanofollis sp.]MDD4253954.1 methyl-coenzyme M reductase glutamine C-methyltransferase [Methanofollis sp.]